MNIPDGHRQVDADGQGGGAREEASDNQQPAEEFGEGGDVSQPGGQAEAVDEFGVVVEAAKHFMGTVSDHNGTESQAHQQEGKRLQTIEVAQIILRKDL
jgi:hypothetical protein